MATRAYPEMTATARYWDGLPDYPTSVFSGIVGDAAHARRGGPHISRQDQPKTNYSVIRPDDRPGNGPDDASCAWDMSMGRSDMIKCTARFEAVYRDQSDPRRVYINAVNGWRGNGDAIRIDFYANKVGYATSDHKSHAHAELKRKYVTDPKAHRAVRSIVAGQTKEQWLASEGGQSATTGGELMLGLKHGDQGEEVQYLQALLEAVGKRPDGGADGNYGDSTAAKVAEVAGSGDGKRIDPYTCRALNARFAKASAAAK